MVLKRSPDLNNVKIGQDQLWLIMKHILFYGGCGHFSLNIFYSIKTNDIQHTYIVNIQRIRTKAYMRPFWSSDLK